MVISFKYSLKNIVFVRHDYPKIVCVVINPLNAELNPICHLLALLVGATIVVVSRLRVKHNKKGGSSIFGQYFESINVPLSINDNINKTRIFYLR